MGFAPSVEELYESFMDEDTEDIYARPFAEDIYRFFGTKSEYSPQEFAEEFGGAQYFAPFDPSGIDVAERERDLDYKKSLDLMTSTKEATDRVYRSEMDTLGTDIRKQMKEGRRLAGATGLRSGTLDTAIEDTLSVSYEKAKDLGDRLSIEKEETHNKYNTAMVDAALDYEKTVQDEKEDFYDRTMASVMKLADRDVFTPAEEKANNYAELNQIQEEEGTFCYNYCAEIFDWIDPYSEAALAAAPDINLRLRTKDYTPEQRIIPTTNMHKCITDCNSG